MESSSCDGLGTGMTGKMGNHHTGTTDTDAFTGTYGYGVDLGVGCRHTVTIHHVTPNVFTMRNPGGCSVVGDTKNRVFSENDGTDFSSFAGTSFGSEIGQ